MNKKYLILIPLFLIWFIASISIAYQGLFYSEYLINFLRKKPQDYGYPLFQVVILCSIYSLWMWSYAYLLCSETAIRRPFLSYTVCSILPIVIPVYGVIILIYSPPDIITFILISCATSLFHFLLLPILMPIYRKYISPKQNASV
ncbi:hypothetical protein ACG93R_06120 [Acinetobacter guillouiae]|uniref:hypothetical protein n=1 Tax=Acinetobacter guillouiae TaxID=106649 RepID=UPI003AF8696D